MINFTIRDSGSRFKDRIDNLTNSIIKSNDNRVKIRIDNLTSSSG